jgi:hypothetical protein
MAKLYNPDPELDMFYRSDTCTVYLLHAARPVFGAQHYAGSTEDLERRLREHRRVWPLYRFDDVTFNDLVDVLPKATLEALSGLYGKLFRRKHTVLKAIHRQAGVDIYDIKILRAARRHTSNGLVMTFNQQKIQWLVARTWKANREFEMYLKRQKNLRRYCPVCHGVTAPEEGTPF